jgi:hypothetical protein
MEINIGQNRDNTILQFLGIFIGKKCYYDTKEKFFLMKKINMGIKNTENCYKIVSILAEYADY